VLWIALDPDSGWIPSWVHHAHAMRRPLASSQLTRDSIDLIRARMFCIFITD
jgi:hypothetical protein